MADPIGVAMPSYISILDREVLAWRVGHAHMLYSSQPKLLEILNKERAGSWSSYLTTNQVFCGQYWDEFCVAGLLAHGQADSALLLGLGLGGAVRPFLAGASHMNITGVDVCEEATAACSNAYQTHFPSLPLKIVTDDAVHYLQTCDRKYDVILVDLYDKSGYARCQTDDDFYNLLENRLTGNGMVFINACSEPAFLDPLGPTGMPYYIARCLAKRFRFIHWLVYRRNISLFASQVEPRATRECDVSSLIQLDCYGVKVSSMRLDILREQKFVDMVGDRDLSRPDSSFEQIDRSIAAGWPRFESKCLDILYGIDSHCHSLAMYLESPSSNEAVDRLVEEGEPFNLFPPVYIASKINHSLTDYSWYIRHCLSRSPVWGKGNFSWHNGYILTQLFAMTANHSQSYRRYAESVSEQLLSSERYASTEKSRDS